MPYAWGCCLIRTVGLEAIRCPYMPAVGLTMSAFDSVRCLPLRDVDSIARASSRSDLFNWPRVIRKEKHDN